jgi:hypothetical protein
VGDLQSRYVGATHAGTMHFSTQELLGTSRNVQVMVVFAYIIDRPGFRQLQFSVVATGQGAH